MVDGASVPLLVGISTVALRLLPHSFTFPSDANIQYPYPRGSTFGFPCDVGNGWKVLVSVYGNMGLQINRLDMFGYFEAP